MHKDAGNPLLVVNRGRALFISAQEPTLYIPLRDSSQRVVIPGEGRVLHLVGFVLTTRIKPLNIAKLE